MITFRIEYRENEYPPWCVVDSQGNIACKYRTFNDAKNAADVANTMLKTIKNVPDDEIPF